MAEKIDASRARTIYRLEGSRPERLPVVFSCAGCTSPIASDMPWVCPYCDFENRRGKLFSFLGKCQSCDREPPTVACPQCDEPNFLDGEEDQSRVAKSARTVERQKEKAAAKSADPLDTLRRAHATKKTQLEQKIELAKLTAELNAIKAPPPDPHKDAREKLRANLEQFDAQFLAAHAVAKEYKTKNEERYKDDPDLLSMANDLVDRWLEEQTR
jgi:hypothetical protein